MSGDTGTMDLSRIEAERRRLASSEAVGAAEVAERIVAEVLAGQRELDEVHIPDDPSALFDEEAPSDADLADDASPADWARRIVSDVLDRHTGSATAAPIIDTERPLEEPEVAPAETVERSLAEGHRAYWAMLAGDDPLALLPGRTVEPDGPAWAPEHDVALERAVDRVLGSVVITPVERRDDQLADDRLSDDQAWAEDVELGADAVAVPTVGRSAGRTAAWILLALVWAGAAASIVPFVFEGTEAAVDFTFDIWGRQP